MKRVLLDTGPWIALLVRNERHHAWAKTQFAGITPPLLTCEPVLTETLFLAARLANGREAVTAMVARGVVKLDFDLTKHFGQVSALMQRYSSVPMSLADACLVRMTEIHADAQVLTLDSDFKVYRRLGRQVVPTIAPRSVAQ